MSAGLVRGAGGLEVYVMAEIPSNVISGRRASRACLTGSPSARTTSLSSILGVDRDSARVASLFDERNEAVQRACADLLATAHVAGRTVGICGQAPSDYPEFAAFLVAHGIDSISLNADAVLRTRRRVYQMEQDLEAPQHPSPPAARPVLVGV